MEAKAHDRIAQIEDHVGCSINNKRLRVHIVSELQRAYDASAALHSNIDAVLNGHRVFDPKNQKAIALPRSQK